MRPHQRPSPATPAPATPTHPAATAMQSSGIDPCALRDILNAAGPDGYNLLYTLVNMFCPPEPPPAPAAPK